MKSDFMELIHAMYFIFVSYFMSYSNHFLQNMAHEYIASVLQKL